MRVRVLALFAVVFAAYLWIDARAQSGGPTVSGAHRFEKVAEGVYYATSAGIMNVGANSPIFVNDDEVLMVESSITPAAARAMVNDIKAIANKPIRFVVDSHYHYDHAHGNQVFISSATVIGETPTTAADQRPRAAHLPHERAASAGASTNSSSASRRKERSGAEAPAGEQIKTSLVTWAGEREKVTPPNLRSIAG